MMFSEKFCVHANHNLPLICGDRYCNRGNPRLNKQQEMNKNEEGGSEAVLRFTETSNNKSYCKN